MNGKTSSLVRGARVAFLAASLAAVAACHHNNDVAGTGGALASLTVDAPDSAHSGANMDIAIRALNIGVSGVHNGHVDITLPAPLTVSAVDASPGTSATFSNTTGGGASVSWTLNTLDSNTQSTLHITSSATVTTTQMVTVRATLTADGIRAGRVDNDRPIMA